MIRKKIEKIKVLIYFYIINIIFFSDSSPAFAGPLKLDVFDKEKQGQAFADSAGYQVSIPYNSFALIVGTVIQAFLSLLGVIFVALIIYAGYNWMIARGEEEKVTRAKDTIRRAIIGLIITIGAYAISFWVIDRINK